MKKGICNFRSKEQIWNHTFTIWLWMFLCDIGSSCILSYVCVGLCVCVSVCLSVMCTTVVWQQSDISCSDILSQFISPASEWTEALEGHSSTSNANLSFCQHQWRALQYISHRHTYTQMHTCIIFFSILLLFDVKWHSDCEVQTVRFNLLWFHDKFDWTAKKNY